ncbi:MAG: glycosyltransferase family 39 protein, partial [Gemmatimonadetes bacterium]|nr:glycosyltransferase family 39 protein [Gemmatimonadota bacterium]
MEALSSRTDPYARRAVIGLIVIATLVRLRFALATELGNDEVYYWAYAAFPDWSHFDHPPMVGWAIQLFTLNLALDSEVFIRLAAVASAAIATWLMYLIGRRIGGERAGLFAAILHTSAVYGSVLAGVVILPDAPLVVFWLLSLWLLLEALPVETIGPREGRLVLLAGVAIGLAILSKYQGLFLGFGAVLYVLLYDRRWLRQPVLYGSMVLAAVIASPILIWNLKNDFIS